MKQILLHILLVFIFFQVNAQGNKHIVYLIPGLGADERSFKNIKLSAEYEIRHIRYQTPEKQWTLTDFAKILAQQIDTTSVFSVVGVSLGGMLATEMADFLHPDKVIIISSAKMRTELPFRYRFQKAIPLYQITPPSIYKFGARILQPIVEPDREKDAKTFKAMLKDKNPLFLKRTTKMIMKWHRMNFNRNIIHIHGDNDHTLPIRNIRYDYLIKDGSHMMVLTRGDEISVMLNRILDSEDLEQN